MNSDMLQIPVKVGDIVWAYDVLNDMKVPLIVMEVYEDNTWKGNIAWTWGMA